MTNLEDKSTEDLENELLGQTTADLLPGDKEGKLSDDGQNPKDEVTTKDDDPEDKGEDGGDDKGASKKQTNDGIKKLLNQRNSAREEAKTFKQERDDALERIKKIKSGELDDEFEDDADKDMALIDAKSDVKLAERDLKRIENSAKKKRDSELSDFLEKNPDLEDLGEDIKNFAKEHPTLGMDHIAKIVIADSDDPTRGMDQQTKNKLKGGLGLGGKPNTTANKTTNDVKDMSDEDLERELESQWESGKL